MDEALPRTPLFTGWLFQRPLDRAVPCAFKENRRDETGAKAFGLMAPFLHESTYPLPTPPKNCRKRETYTQSILTWVGVEAQSAVASARNSGLRSGALHNVFYGPRLLAPKNFKKLLAANCPRPSVKGRDLPAGGAARSLSGSLTVVCPVNGSL